MTRFSSKHQFTDSECSGRVPKQGRQHPSCLRPGGLGRGAVSRDTGWEENVGGEEEQTEQKIEEGRYALILMVSWAWLGHSSIQDSCLVNL